MKIITINKNDVQGPFVVPPECGGQMYEISYACTDTYILECRIDKSGPTRTQNAYYWPKICKFAPQNEVPSLGRLAGEFILVGD